MIRKYSGRKTQLTIKGVLFASVFLVQAIVTSSAQAAPIKVLSDTSHAFSAIVGAINAMLGPGHIGTDVIVHYTGGAMSADINKALDTGATYYDPSSNPVASQAPYNLFTTSGTMNRGDTMTEYNLSATYDIAHNYAYSPTPFPGMTAPSVFHISPGGGSNGFGVEFVMDATECAPFDCSSQSAQVASFAGIEVALRVLHPTWNWFDVKAALRQTTSRWAIGYLGGWDGAGAGWGFGVTDHVAANALTDNQLLLQSPGVKNLSSGGLVGFEVYPFKQTRRVKEVLFQFASAPSFHANEMTLAEVQALGGVKVAEYSGVTAKEITPVSGAVSNVYFVWLTADDADDSVANFSRIDTFSAIGPISQSARIPADAFETAPFVTGDFLTGVSLDTTNNKIYATDSAANTIVRMDSGSGGTTFGANRQTFGSVGSGSGQFNNPYITTIDSANNKVYVSDIVNARIVRMDSGSGGTTFGGNFESFGTYGPGAGEFDTPVGLAVDSAHHKLYVSDFVNNRIVRMDSGSGGTTLGGSWEVFGSLGSGSGEFNSPYMIVLRGADNKLYVADSMNARIVRMDSGSGGTTLGGNFESFGSGLTNPFGVAFDGVQDKLYVVDGNTFVRMDSGSGGTTLGGNFETFGNVYDIDDDYKTLALNGSINVVDGVVYLDTSSPSGASYVSRILPTALSATRYQQGQDLSDRFLDCSTSNKSLGVYLPWNTTHNALNNLTIMNCPAGGMLLRSALTSAKNLVFVNTPTTVIDEAGGYSATTSFDDGADGDAHVDATGHPLYNSPLIDTGSTVTGRSTDASGNPIYGTPDMGAYEYQPPYTAGTDGIDISAGARIYGDGKFRDHGTVSASIADLSVVPGAGSFPSYGATDLRPQWMDISSITWSNTGTRHKRWTENSDTIGAASTLHTVGDLAPSTPYVVSVDDVIGADIVGAGGTLCTSGICTSDAMGTISFTYTGGYSTHTFDVIQDTTAPILSITSPTTGAIVSGDDTITFTNSEATNPECSLDNTLWDGCTSGTTSFSSLTGWSALAESVTLTLFLRDTDPSGNTGTTSVANLSKADTVAPIRSGGSPSGTLSAGTFSTTLSVTTDETATCRYSTSSQTYASMTDPLTTSDGLSHTVTLSGLSDASSYTYYIRCQDTSSNANDTDYLVSFAVDVAAAVPAVMAQEEEEEKDIDISRVKATPETDSIVITWKTKDKAESSVRYGTGKDLKEKKKESRKEKSHRIVLKDLSPDTEYFFRIKSEDGDGNEDKSRIHSVKTKPAPRAVSEDSVTLPEEKPQENGLTTEASRPSSDATPNTCSYVVQAGDTLWNIAKEVYSDASAYPLIIERNRERYPDIASRLAIGQELTFACVKGASVDEADSQQPEDQPQLPVQDEPQTFRWWNPFTWF